MDAEQLRQALIEHGFTEAAAMAGADVEAQALEGTRSATTIVSSTQASVGPTTTRGRVTS